MKHFFSKIISNVQIAKNFYQILFDWNKNDVFPEPGQFLTIRVSDSTIPLLRRPFAFSGYDKYKRTASVIYQKRGIATEILSRKKTGDTLDIIGHIGNTFQIDQSIDKCIIIAGGTGLGPMIYLTSSLEKMAKKIIFIFGCTEKAFIPDEDIFKSLKPVICTNDGSKGFKGTTVDYLNSLHNKDIKNATIFACGPIPMLKGCHEYAKAHNLQCQVSMEQVMACGVGACMGCAIKVVKGMGYERVCKEGPVFDSREIVWT